MSCADCDAKEMVIRGLSDKVAQLEDSLQKEAGRANGEAHKAAVATREKSEAWLRSRELELRAEYQETIHALAKTVEMIASNFYE